MLNAVSNRKLLQSCGQTPFDLKPNCTTGCPANFDWRTVGTNGRSTSITPVRNQFGVRGAGVRGRAAWASGKGVG